MQFRRGNFIKGHGPIK